jgi:hypothetical protein
VAGGGVGGGESCCGESRDGGDGWIMTTFPTTLSGTGPLGGPVIKYTSDIVTNIIAWIQLQLRDLESSIIN